MLSNYYQTNCEMMPKPDDRYTRDEAKDMGTAVELLYNFRKELGKLHPNCIQNIERMLQYLHR